MRRSAASRLLPLATLLIAGCAASADPISDVQTVRWENGRKRAEGQLIAGRHEGRWTYWYQYGQKREEGSYRAGRKTGTWTRWHRNDQVQSITNYVDGRRHGAFISYRRDGDVLERGEFVEGQRHGLWTQFHPKGRTEVRFEWGVEVARTRFPRSVEPALE